MKRLILILTSLCLPCLQLTGLRAAETPATIVVHGPTIVAFFPPVPETELQKDSDTNEALADFQVYAARVREPLKKSGIEFHELSARSFQVRRGNTVTTFRPAKAQIGYYFVAPGKKPRIEYGVMTDVDLLEIVHEYFGTPIQSGYPRSPQKATILTRQVSQALVGEQVTILGKLSLQCKQPVCIKLDNNYQLVYLFHTKGESYSEMDGKRVSVTGILRFYHAPDPKPADNTRARLPDCFYFDAETTQVRLIHP